MIDFLKTIDLEKTDPATVELLKSMQGAVQGAFDEFLKDSLNAKELDAKIAEAIKGIDSRQEIQAVRSSLAEVKEALVRMKGAFEKGNNGEMHLKSMTRQVEDQLKDFITLGKNGEKVVDLRNACKNAPGFKKTITVVATKEVPIVSGNLAYMSNTVDQEISMDPRAKTVLRDFANVANIATRTLTYAEFTGDGTDAEWVEEGGLKPLMGGTLTEVVINAGKVALGTKVTEETLADLSQFVAEIESEIISKIGVKEETGILTGSGSNGEPKGITTDLPAYSLDSITVSNANIFDAIVAAYAQIVNMSEQAYTPNAVLLNPVDFYNMQLAKDANGQYLRPFFVNGELIPGLQVVATTSIEQGKLLIGDFSRLNIRDVLEMTITMGWENDDFTKNLVTLIGEKRLMSYIKSQYKTAFVYDDIDTVIEAISVGSSDSNGGGDGNNGGN